MPNSQEFLASLDPWVRESVRLTVTPEYLLMDPPPTIPELVERAAPALPLINSVHPLDAEGLAAYVTNAALRAGYPGEAPEEEVPAQTADERRAELEALTKEGLQDEARALDLPVAGTKAELVDRIMGRRT